MTRSCATSVLLYDRLHLSFNFMILLIPLLISLLLYLFKENNHDILLYGSFSVIFSLILTESLPINVSSEKILLFFITILVIY